MDTETLPAEIPAITLHQPWASLVAHGDKQIETRIWAPAYRGPIAIHSAREIPMYARHMVAESRPIRRILEGHGYETLDDLLCGYVLAIAHLTDVAKIPERSPIGGARGVAIQLKLSNGWALEVSSQEEILGNYARGRWAWYFSEVAILQTPIAAKGRQGLWPWPTTRIVSERPSSVIAKHRPPE